MVTNMPGFFTIKRGFNFLNASPIAGPTIFQSKSDTVFCVIRWTAISEEFSALHEEVLDNRAQSERREKVERTDQEHSPKKQNEKGAARNWKRARAWWRDFLMRH
jgi:hypothetical protein